MFNISFPIMSCYFVTRKPCYRGKNRAMLRQMCIEFYNKSIMERLCMLNTATATLSTRTHLAPNPARNTLTLFMCVRRRLPFLDANTNTSGGLYVMMKQVFNVANGDRPDVPDTAIVITDGRSTYDSNLTIPYAEEAKRRGIEIFGMCSIAHRLYL